jgi:hypothetical protein
VTVRVPKKRAMSRKPPMRRGLRPRRSITKPWSKVKEREKESKLLFHF